MGEQEKPLAPHVLSIGSFGRAVARYLHTSRPDLIETQVVDDTIALPTVWPSSFAVILASWRPVPHFCELLDQLSFAWNQPFIPMILDSTMLRIGPVVIPGKGSCWACWARRYKQHDSWRKERGVLLEYYAAHPEAGPKGYLEPFAMIGASRLAMILASLNGSNPPAGQIWQIDTITRETTQGVVTGIHDCPQCGLHRPASERSFSFLRRDLAYLWAQPAERE